MDIVGKSKIIAEGNYYINDRLPIISAAITLFMEKKYIAFVYLVTPQIEGLFRVLQQSIKGDRADTRGMKEVIEKIHNNEDFWEFVYFAYDFPEWRNKIAHGEMIEVDREFACEIMMDLYWILRTIDSEEQDYRKLMSFLNDFCSKQDLKMMVECLASYFASIESEKYLELLKRFFEGEFDSIVEWYGIVEQKQKFIETIHSEELYLLIWNDEPLELETTKKVQMEDGEIKEFNVIDLNDNSLKYYRLLSLLNEYNYVSLKEFLPHIYIVTLDQNLYEKIEYKNSTCIVTDGTYFLHSLKNKLIAEKLIVNSGIMGDIELQKYLVCEIHSKIASIDFKTYPEVIYCLAYQDGICHAFDRFIQLYKTGNYNIPGVLNGSLKAYDKITKDKKKQGNYWDASYYEGYMNGLMYILLCGEKHPMVNSFPLFYLPNTKAEMNSFESFEEELCKVSKFKGKYHKYAIKVLENLLEAEEIVVHHPPF